MSIIGKDFRKIGDELSLRYKVKGLLKSDSYGIRVRDFVHGKFSLEFSGSYGRGLVWTDRRYEYLKGLVGVGADIRFDDRLVYRNEDIVGFYGLIGIRVSRGDMDRVERVEEMLNEYIVGLGGVDEIGILRVCKNVHKTDTYYIKHETTRYGLMWKWNKKKRGVIEGLLNSEVRVSSDWMNIVLDRNELNQLYVLLKMYKYGYK